MPGAAAPGEGKVCLEKTRQVQSIYRSHVIALSAAVQVPKGCAMAVKRAFSAEVPTLSGKGILQILDETVSKKYTKATQTSHELFLGFCSLEDAASAHCSTLTKLLEANPYVSKKVLAEGLMLFNKEDCSWPWVSPLHALVQVPAEHASARWSDLLAWQRTIGGAWLRAFWQICKGQRRLGSRRSGASESAFEPHDAHSSACGDRGTLGASNGATGNVPR